jgi:hypothetical protein
VACRGRDRKRVWQGNLPPPIPPPRFTCGQIESRAEGEEPDTNKKPTPAMHGDRERNHEVGSCTYKCGYYPDNSTS